MKYAKFALALLSLALLVVPTVATAAQKHHAKKCPAGKHRNGQKCVKNRTAAARNPGSQGTSGTSGSTTSSGSTGSTGVAGPEGPPGPVGPQGPEGKLPVKTSEVVYDNIDPTTLVENPSSLGFAATGTAEFGQKIKLAGSARETPEVTALMSVWACQRGAYYNTTGPEACSTTPGAKFSVPITVNIYAAGPNHQVGALVDHETETFQLPYRPTGDCLGDLTAYVNANGECNHGLPVPIHFNLHGVTLPDEVIVSIAYNASGSGYDARTAFGPADDLNLGLEGAPSLGTDPDEGSGVYAATGGQNKGGGELPNTEEVFGFVAEKGWEEAEAALSVTASR